MSNLFRSVKRTKVKRNRFDLGHEVKLTTNFGELRPVLCERILPQDIAKCRTEMLMRCAPLFGPVMHRVNAYLHFYYVNDRLIMDGAEVFHTGGETGDGTYTKRNGTVVKPEKPYLFVNQVLGRKSDAFSKSSLADALNFPTDFPNGASSSQKVNLMPFKVYQLIYNEYYRDQNFQKEIDIVKDQIGRLDNYLSSEGLTNTQINEIIVNLFTIRQRNWEKDYFTSALPFTQRGDGQNVLGSGDIFLEGEGEVPVQVGDNGEDSVDVGAIANQLFIKSNSIVSVNDFRIKLATQKVLEKLARFGSRFVEFLMGEFGTAPIDAVLQRPVFLGGGKVPMSFGEVLQTSQTTESSPQGSYAGRGISAGELPGFKATRFKEYGWLIGILSVMPKPSYQQGWPREYDKWDRFDEYLPEFQHLGEQAIKNKELVFNPNRATFGEGTFGYTPRYAEYRYAPDRVHGDFRTTLASWHMGRIFDTAVNHPLNSSFLQCKDEDVNRIFNVTGTDIADHLWIQMYHDLNMLRPMSKYGTPLI